MPRILILSTTTGYQLRSFADAAAKLGVDLVYATDRCHTLDDPWQDAAIPVRFHEEEDSVARIVAEAQAGRFDGIVAVGDRPTVLAAMAAERLALPGNPPDAARASANKLLARSRYRDAGLGVPWYYVVQANAGGRAASADPRLRFPAVIKPLGLSGSRGVIRVDSPSEFVTAFERVRALLRRHDVRAMRSGLDDEILVEGFIDGCEYAVEGVLTSGTFQPLAVFDKPDPLAGPFFEETIYVTPPALPAATEAAIIDQVQCGARALGLVHGPIHAECRLTAVGIFILEIAARPIGGLCSKALRFRRFDDATSLEQILLRHAIGEDVTRWHREAAASAVMMIPIPRRGVLRRVDGQDAARAVPRVEDVRITAKTDQLLEPLPEAGSYLGFIFARAAAARDAEAAVREAHRRLTFVIDTPIDVAAV
jgi:biotin carboxylase